MATRGRTLYREEFAAAMAEAKGDRSLRQMAIKIQRSHTHAQNLLNGWVPPTKEEVEEIADALGYDRERLAVAAGYVSGAEVFVRGLHALYQEYDQPLHLDLRGGVFNDQMSVADAEALLKDVREDLELERRVEREKEGETNRKG
jgi:hypothetical protein